MNHKANFGSSYVVQWQWVNAAEVQVWSLAQDLPFGCGCGQKKGQILKCHVLHNDQLLICNVSGYTYSLEKKDDKTWKTSKDSSEGPTGQEYAG